MPKEYYLYVNGQRVKVSEQIYKVYWREKEHEKYLEQVDKKNHLLFFLMTLVSWGGGVSETKNHPLCGCEIKVKQLKKHPFLIK